MPVFSYFLAVGAVLAGLLYYATDVIAPAAMPFSVAQTSGLPPPFKAPPEVKNTSAPAPQVAQVEAKPNVPKAAHKQKAAVAARHSLPAIRYADYPSRDPANIW